MIFSISFFNKVLKVVLFVVLLSGAPVWTQAISETGRIDTPVPRLAEQEGVSSEEIKVIHSSGQAEFESSEFYKLKRPEAASMVPLPEHLTSGTAVVWLAEPGGDAKYTYGFEVEKDGVIQQLISTGSDPRYVWTPEAAGRYRVRILATDESGEQHISLWSEAVQVVSVLNIQTPRADHSSPQVAHSKPVTWSLEASDSSDDLSYVFELEESGRIMSRVGTGNQPSWTWRPHQAGSYRVRVRATDRHGNRAVSQWSDVYRIEPPLHVEVPILPSENRTVVALSEVPLRAAAAGGVGTVSYLLLVEKDGEMMAPIAVDNLEEITWTPDATGSYRLGLFATDILKNQAVSPWTEQITVIPALKAYIDKQIETAPGQVVWTAAATGGIGPYTYEFFQRHEDGPETPVAGDGRSLLNWSPELLGDYRLKVVVTDSVGNQAESLWSEPYRIAPQLQVTEPRSDAEGRQVEFRTVVRWSVESSGGYGRKTYRFMLRRNDEDPQLVQTSHSPVLEWDAEQSGHIRVLVVVEDALKHRVQSSWSAAVEVVNNRVQASPAAPHKALSGPVKWSYDYLGDKGDVDFTYELIENNETVLESTDSEPEWVWYPKIPGNYKVKATVTDDAGHVIASDVSDVYRITPAVDRNSEYVVFPPENLSGVRVPLDAIGDTFSTVLKQQGYDLLDDEELNRFLKENRVRYTGGVDSRISRELRSSVDRDAVFILSVETYQENAPPKISLHARLVICGDTPQIAWMESVGLSGDEAPGFLGLGIIENDRILYEKAVRELMVSFNAYVDNDPQAYTTGGTVTTEKLGKTLPIAPKTFYRSDDLDLNTYQMVVVLPFTNRFARKNSEKVVPLHLVQQLLKYENLFVVEPGLVREALLNYRIVMEGGPSLSVADLIGGRGVLNADLLIAGNVFDYQGQKGEPKVHFSVQVVETENQEVVWWSNSYAGGNDRVLLFDAGSIHSAHGLTERLSQSVVTLLRGNGIDSLSSLVDDKGN